MNIKLLDSWLREYLKTDAKADKIAEVLSLTSVSVERVEKIGNDYLYDIEVTTNRPDLMSVNGIAREAAISLNSATIKAEYIPRTTKKVDVVGGVFPIKITNDPSLVNRIMAIVLEVHIDKSPQVVRDRLEASDIRSLNNVIDVTNYIMRETGHPAHVFDADRLTSNKLNIRESKKGEKIITLDKKEYILPGGDIVADNGSGEIVDLLGIMGSANSVVQDNTTRIILFLDNNDHKKIRKTSMSLGIRSEAAILNEKGVDPELMENTLLRGVELLKDIAQARVLSPIFDTYPHKVAIKPVTVTFEKIDKTIGIEIPKLESIKILTGLGFNVKHTNQALTATPPTWRAGEITIPEDLIEEIARIYGYHKIPNKLPELTGVEPTNLSKNAFYWESKIKHALKYWGFTELYTSSLVSEDLLEVAPSEAVKLANPLTDDMVYLRTTLIPSLLEAVRSNKNIDDLAFFEIANVYIKTQQDLPLEKLMLAGIIKKPKASFYLVKGVIEGLFHELGIKQFDFKKSDSGGQGADIFLEKKKIGTIETLDTHIINFEIEFEPLLKNANMKKVFIPFPKFPAAVEDMRILIPETVEYEKIISTISAQSKLITRVELLDTYEDKKTFRITYQSAEKNLTGPEISAAREKIIQALTHTLKAEIV